MRTSGLVWALTSLAVLSSVWAAEYKDPNPGNFDPSKLPLYVAENVYEEIEGIRDICRQLDPASLAVVENRISDFHNRFSELVELTKRSRYLSAARDRAFAAHKTLLSMYSTSAERKELARSMCGAEGGRVLGMTSQEQHVRAAQWAKILRDSE